MVLHQYSITSILLFTRITTGYFILFLLKFEATAAAEVIYFDFIREADRVSQFATCYIAADGPSQDSFDFNKCRRSH